MSEPVVGFSAEHHATRVQFWRNNDAALRACAAEGMTTRETAAALGVTKNAVVGRANRLRVVWARKPVARIEPASTPDPFPPPGRCVYPHGHHGEAGFAFCGGEVVGFNHPYCVDHHLICYQRVMPGNLSEHGAR